MELGVVLAAGLVMALGLVGTVVPLVPGLPLIWLAALGSWLATGWSGAATLTMVVLSVLLLVGSLLKYCLPSQSARATGAPNRALFVASAAGLVGVFVVPLIGFPLGFVLGLFLVERDRLTDTDAAWDSTVATLKAYGVGVLAEVAAGLAMVATWLAVVVWG